MSSILITKLYTPGRPSQQIRRGRLVERLEEGFRSGRRLSLVSAPAGFGKTSLVVEWLAEAGHPHTWLSLDESDNDPVRFFHYLLAAVQRVYPDLGESTASLISGPQLPAMEGLAASLVNDLAAAGQPLVLVLDDYHLIRSAEIHQSVQMMVERMPPKVHLVLATREDPPLPLARLRVRGQMTEIRLADLRFTLDESGDFLQASLGRRLPEGAVASLEERTEGWIAGLQLAAIFAAGPQRRAAVHRCLQRQPPLRHRLPG